MPKRVDRHEALRRLADPPICQACFARGFPTALLPLAGIEATAGFVNRRRNLPVEIAVAAGILSILPLATPHLGRSWVASSAVETMGLGSLTGKAAPAKREAEASRPPHREPEAQTSK